MFPLERQDFAGCGAHRSFQSLLRLSGAMPQCPFFGNVGLHSAPRSAAESDSAVKMTSDRIVYGKSGNGTRAGRRAPRTNQDHFDAWNERHSSNGTSGKPAEDSLA
jgi:hypothetical protein